MCRYKQTVDCVLAFRDSKHTNVKQQVMLLIPKMSEFAPEKFVLSYLEPCTAHLLSVLANKSHANSIAFQAFGQMIAPLAGPTSSRELARRLQCRLPDIEREMLDALAVKGSREQAKRSTCVEAITCVGVMAEVRSRHHVPGAEQLVACSFALLHAQALLLSTACSRQVKLWQQIRRRNAKGSQSLCRRLGRCGSQRCFGCSSR